MTPMPMEDQIFEIVEHVWRAFVGMDLARRDALPGGEAGGYFLVASIAIEGAWEGEAALFCSEPLAHRMAAHLFEMAPADVGPDEVRETLGEISNIIGGNLKRLLPEPCHLSIPVVGYERNLKAHAARITAHAASKVLACCETEYVVVMLAERRRHGRLVIDAL